MTSYSEQFQACDNRVWDTRCLMIIRQALGIGYADMAVSNQYTAAVGGDELMLCHLLADNGLMYFHPTEKRPTLFLVTPAGAAAVGCELAADDAEYLDAVLASSRLPGSAYETWRAEVRTAQLCSKVAPCPTPEADLVAIVPEAAWIASLSVNPAVVLL